jgi:hypothetical protein
LAAFAWPYDTKAILQDGIAARLIKYLNVELLTTNIVSSIQSPISRGYNQFTVANSAKYIGSFD